MRMSQGREEMRAHLFFAARNLSFRRFALPLPLLNLIQEGKR
jgi:hypothetical protein